MNSKKQFAGHAATMAVYASPPRHAMGINPPLVSEPSMVAPRAAAEGHCSAAGPVVLIPKLGLHRVPRCAAHSRFIDRTRIPRVAAVTERYRRMTPDQRISIASSMFETARKIVESFLPPNMTRKERRLAFARRLYAGEPRGGPAGVCGVDRLVVDPTMTL